MVHGGAEAVPEGAWPGDLVVIGFPDRARGQGWYGSPAYRAILLLRIAQSEGAAIVVDGVGEGHGATDALAG